MPRRERPSVTAVEAIGPYTLVRIARGSLDAGTPGQFFMLEAPGRVLPRPFSLCFAPRGELAFLVDPIGPGTRAIAAVQPGDHLASGPVVGIAHALDMTRFLVNEAPLHQRRGDGGRGAEPGEHE